MRQKTLRYVLALAGVFALVAGQAAPASATPGIVFEFEETAGFEFGSATVTPSGIPPVQGGVEFFGAVNDPLLGTVYSTIGWGCTFPGGANCAPEGNTVTATDPLGNTSRSALDLQGLSGVVVSTDSTPLPDEGWVTISVLTHKNQVITGNHLNTVLIDAVLRLNSVEDEQQDTLLNFDETVNIAPCAPPNPVGSVCDDFWAFDPTALLEPVVFTHNGETFIAEFRIGDLTNAVFDPATGRIYTAEGQTSTLELEMRIVQAVPEPASLMLLGTGLIGVGFFAATRRRK